MECTVQNRTGLRMHVYRSFKNVIPYEHYVNIFSEVFLKIETCNNYPSSRTNAKKRKLILTKQNNKTKAKYSGKILKNDKNNYLFVIQLIRLRYKPLI